LRRHCKTVLRRAVVGALAITMLKSSMAVPPFFLSQKAANRLLLPAGCFHELPQCGTAGSFQPNMTGRPILSGTLQLLHPS
jgi:hypothetical protein